MPTKSQKNTRSKKATKTVQEGCKSCFCHPSTWLIALLAVALIAVCGVAAFGFRALGSRSDMDSAKLAVFNDVAETYIRENDVTDNGIREVYQMTGYGISDEDGVFYITFSFVDPSDPTIAVAEDGTISAENLRYGVMYFWPSDTSTSGYSHAFSYHDSDYHPGGEYRRL